MSTSEAPTPENTPIPGPGAWRWSRTEGAWVPNTPQAAEADESAAGEQE